MYRGSRQSQCTGKIGHKTAAKARAAAKKTGNDRKGRLNIYRCPWCNKFHVGRVPNRNGVKTR